MMARTFASILPRQSLSSLIRASIKVEADSAGMAFFMYGSNLAQVAGGLQAAPGDVGERPRSAGGRPPAPGIRTVAYREMGDEGGGEVDGEAGVGPFLQPRRPG